MTLSVEPVLLQFGSKMASIFIQLASYHDYELPGTILNAIEMSSGQHQINFGVHHNYYELDDIPLPELPNVRATISKAPHNLGMGISREIAHSFYRGEDYYMQVDAHTRFRKNWDINCISEVDYYKSLGFKKPLLTTYPRNYWYEDGVIKADNGWTVSCISFEEDKERFATLRIPSQTAWGNAYGNVFSRSVSGGSIFAVGPLFTPNRNTHSIGEEILIAARAYTHGYDLLIPRENQLSHLYYDHNKPHANGRRMVWQDFPEKSSEFESMGIGEVQSIFKNNTIGDQGFGTERTLEEFEVFSGLDFTSGAVISREATSSDTRLASLSCPVGIWNP
jgi:hypothetical protein